MIKELIYEPWPWWIGGPLIGIFVTLFLLIERKQLGISSSYQYICSKVSPWKLDYFRDTGRLKWQFLFVLGVVLGGVLVYLTTPAYDVALAEGAANRLATYGIGAQKGYLPEELYNWSTKSIVVLGIGGILLGFGARYANGCTAGHAIMGNAQLAPSSIISTVFFFVGGLISTYLIIPILF